MRQFVDMRFAREMIRRRREPAIRALSQRGIRRVKTDVRVRNVVLDLNPGSSRVVIMKLPGSDGAVGFSTALDVDYTRRPKVGPGKFLFASPHQLYGFAGSFGQSRGFDGAFAGVFAAVA